MSELPRSQYADGLAADGFAIIPSVLDAQTISALAAHLESVAHDNTNRQRGESNYGIRDLLNVVPAVRDLAGSPSIRSIVEPLAGSRAKVVRGIFFDKTPDANWKVTWHQDLTIAVRQQKQVAGFEIWSRKAGIMHVQAPASVLERILTVRLHLDATDESNGALKVIPGSHRHGRLAPETMSQWKEKVPAVTCDVPQGGAMLMRPLLLHASSASLHPSHRRVVHLEFTADELPGGLEWHGS